LVLHSAQPDSTVLFGVLALGACLLMARVLRDPRGARLTDPRRGLCVAAGSGDPYRGEIARGDQRVILRLSRETQLRRRQVVASTVAFFVAAAIALLALL